MHPLKPKKNHLPANHTAKKGIPESLVVRRHAADFPQTEVEIQTLRVAQQLPSMLEHRFWPFGLCFSLFLLLVSWGVYFFETPRTPALSYFDSFNALSIFVVREYLFLIFQVPVLLSLIMVSFGAYRQSFLSMLLGLIFAMGFTLAAQFILSLFINFDESSIALRIFPSVSMVLLFYALGVSFLFFFWRYLSWLLCAFLVFFLVFVALGLTSNYSGIIFSAGLGLLASVLTQVLYVHLPIKPSQWALHLQSAVFGLLGFTNLYLAYTHLHTAIFSITLSALCFGIAYQAWRNRFSAHLKRVAQEMHI